jgi:2-(1,2-epoxy-1,2-dihydrophenyl)acetyl-CoA isomerase
VKTSKIGAVLVICLNSPENRNSLTPEFRKQLGEAVALADNDAEVRSVFLTAEGPTFCSGGDLKALTTSCDPWTVHRRFRALKTWLFPLVGLDKPVVIGVNGHAVGGGMGLALTGDLVIASESAKFMSGFFKLGVMPDIGMMYHLPRLIGMAQAKNFLFSGGTFTAEQAAQLGLVFKVVPDAELYEAGLAQAQRLAEGPGQALAMSNPEFHEGLEAALQRREADFINAKDLKF